MEAYYIAVNNNPNNPLEKQNMNNWIAFWKYATIGGKFSLLSINIWQNFKFVYVFILNVT